MLSTYAQKLLAWFGIYQVTPTEYSNRLDTLPKVQRRGVFVSALSELVAYEAAYGYFTF